MIKAEKLLWTYWKEIDIEFVDHRCLKLLSTMMAMNGDETNESNAY